MPGPSRLLAVDSEECNSFLEEQFKMRKLLVFAFLVGTFSLAAFAQEAGVAPKAEFFGGFQYSRYDGGLNAPGWDTAVTGNINRWFGIAADFSGGYGSQSGVSIHNYTYTFGPVVSLRQSRTFTPFAHFLAGGNRASASFSGISGSSNGFAMMFGGGLDINAGQHFAIRGAQFDWLTLHSNRVTDKNNVRIATGVVFRY
jgi:hypothetical protein